MHKASALELADALHPSAAVGGTPTLKALEVINELEGMERGHYAGPVGWIDANAGCCSESSSRSSQWMEVEDYAVATSQIAQPHCARCWAGFAALIGGC